MITKSQAQRIIDVAVEYAHGYSSGVEVCIEDVQDASARFGNNGMTQHLNRSNTQVSIRVLVNGRQARMSSTDLSVRGIRKLVDDAIEVCEGLPKKDKTVLKLIAPSGRTELIEPINRFDRRVRVLTADDREAAVKSIIEIAKDNDLIASGVYTHGTTVYAIGNSRGLFQYDKQSLVQCSITMTGDTSSGWSKKTAWRLAEVDPAALARIAAEKAIASRNPVAVAPGRYTVILEPDAVVDLIGFLWDEFTGTAHVDRNTCFDRKVGKRVLGENITITDDAYHPLQIGRAFDDEGVARSTKPLVQNGIIRTPVAGRHSAKLLGGRATGHALQQPSLLDEFPMNLVVDGGDTDVDEMIRSTERGILLTRVWYVRDVDWKNKIITGMTRDGTFLIEDGKVKCGIKNMRFNISLVELLKNVEALGTPVLASGEEIFPAVVPPMKVREFQFSSKAKH